MSTSAGELLDRAAKLDRMLHLPGMALTPRDIDVEEWNALEILWAERERARSKS